MARRPSLAWGRFTSLANLAQSPPVMATLCQGNQCGTGDWREGSKLWPVQTTLPGAQGRRGVGENGNRVWLPRLCISISQSVPFLDQSTNNAKRMRDRLMDRLIAARNASGRIPASDRDKAPPPFRWPSQVVGDGASGMGGEGFQRVAESRLARNWNAGPLVCRDGILRQHARLSASHIPIPPPREASESHAGNDTRMFDGPVPLRARRPMKGPGDYLALIRQCRCGMAGT